jgi:Carboxypeptidase regulatory-like domain
MTIAYVFGLAAICVVVAPAVYCQQVAGTARVTESNAGSPGTSIVLVSPSGVIIAGTLSRSDGRYLLRAPTGGRFRIRARRIGFAPDSSEELTFTAGGELHFDPVLKPLTTSLQAVSVEGTDRCFVRPGSGAQAFRLWEAVQNALSATIAASGGKQFAFRLGRFEREIDPVTGRIIHGSAWQMRALSSEPYYSVSPDSLVVTGFAKADGDSSIYFAPDARTLTSEVFARTHCIRSVQDPANPERIGLGFEPVSHTALVDVGGVLWLDRASGELRTLDYRYEPPAGRRTQEISSGPESATGRIEYRRLDNGGWIVDRWIIRVPVQKEERNNTVSSSGAGGNLTVRSSRVTRATAIWEIGGDVTAVLDPSNSGFSEQSEVGDLRGSVTVGPNHVGVPGVEIEIASTSTSVQHRRRVTDTNGLFAFDSLPEGEYTLTAGVPAFDTLNTLVAPVSLRIGRNTQQTVTIAVPSSEDGRAALCPASNSPDAIIVHGFVTDSATGQPVIGARVDAYWLTGAMRSNIGLSASAHERTTLTDKSGKYVLCGMEPTTRLLLIASLGLRKSRRSPSITLAEGSMRLANLQIPR